MTLASRPLKVDVALRDWHDRQRANTDNCDICAQGAEFERAACRMVELAPMSAIAARPVRMRARYDGLCAACGAPIIIDDPIWWTRGNDGVECERCGGRK
jgi:DNA-directed RNA polymerase subunit RPC12/RpoP